VSPFADARGPQPASSSEKFALPVGDRRQSGLSPFGDFLTLTHEFYGVFFYGTPFVLRPDIASQGGFREWSERGPVFAVGSLRPWR
jgi:hypothetical protein